MIAGGGGGGACRLLALILLGAQLAACTTPGRHVPVQERSPVISRESLPPTLPRSGPASAATPGARPAAPTGPVPPHPATPATAGLLPPQPTGAAEDPVAVATPLRPEGGSSSGSVRDRSIASVTPPLAAKGAQPAPANGASVAPLPTLEWNWPVDTPITRAYSEASKGIDFGGALGQPVRAAAAGVVSYVGDSLRGYGRMVVLKHDKGYLSVYAHNRQILVKDGERVERGQRIAEMGNSDSNEVVLHFELRHQGRPLDPSRVLPGR